MKLIQSFDYDEIVKVRFIKDVQANLYKSHVTFLSSPLLCSIMMLTYKEFAEIPQKIHAFYAMAFDVLMYKHDVYKDQFQREFYSKLSKEDLRDCFTAFCAISYFKDQFSFTDEKLYEIASDAIRYVNVRAKGKIDADPNSIVRDFTECVCMLQPDGIETTFVHRSFQEFFSARFITQQHSGKVRAIVDSMISRLSDSVIPMLYSMDSSTLVEEWILPTMRDISIYLRFPFKPDELEDLLSTITNGLYVQVYGNQIMFYTSYSDYKFIFALHHLARIFPELQEDIVLNASRLISFKEARSLIANSFVGSIDDRDELLKLLDFSSKKGKTADVTSIRGVFHQKTNAFWWIDKQSLVKSFGSLASGIDQLTSELTVMEQQQASIIDALLGPPVAQKSVNEPTTRRRAKKVVGNLPA